MSFFTGTPMQERRLSGVPEDTFSRASNYYKGLLDDDSEFNAFAAPELRRFKQQIMPDIAEQFGGAGALSSSGFQNAAATAGADLSERLGALRARLRQSAAEGLTNIGNMGTYVEDAKPGLVDFIGPALGAAGAAFGGPVAGAAGNLAGNWLASKFR